MEAYSQNILSKVEITTSLIVFLGTEDMNVFVCY